MVDGTMRGRAYPRSFGESAILPIYCDRVAECRVVGSLAHLTFVVEEDGEDIVALRLILPIHAIRQSREIVSAAINGRGGVSGEARKL